MILFFQLAVYILYYRSSRGLLDRQEDASGAFVRCYNQTVMPECPKDNSRLNRSSHMWRHRVEKGNYYGRD